MRITLFEQPYTATVGKAVSKVGVPYTWQIIDGIEYITHVGRVRFSGQLNLSLHVYPRTTTIRIELCDDHEASGAAAFLHKLPTAEFRQHATTTLENLIARFGFLTGHQRHEPDHDDDDFWRTVYP